MEFASKIRWAIVITIVLLGLVLVGWGLFSIANSVFRGSDNDNPDFDEFSSVYQPQSASVVKFTVDGPVVANEEHRSYTIEVTSRVVTMRVYKQYGQVITEQKSYQNTQEAFDTFIKALEYAGATNRLKGTTIDDDYDEQGVCASGLRYIVEFDDDIRRWGTSCTLKQGTSGIPLRANILSLFQKQVPDYNELRAELGF